MEKLGTFVSVKALDSTGWASLHRGFWVEGKTKERCLFYQVPQALQSPDRFPHHIAVLDLLHHEMADGKFLFGHKYISGFPLSLVLARCDRDGFPLPLDHALLIMERVLSGWEDYKLGFSHPFLIWMTFDGEVKCSPLPVASAFPRWKPADLLPWFSPQLAAGQEWGRTDQVWAAGALFFQLLTGQVFPGGASEDDRVAAIVKTPAMAEGPVPKDLQMILLKALASKPEERYPSVKDMREELGQLIYSGAYTPTTFNLAFFMHTLFREEADGEEKTLAKEDALDLAPLLAPPPKPAAPPPAAAAPVPARPTPSFAQAPASESAEKKSPTLFLALGAVAVLAVAAGLFFLRGGPEPPAAPAASQADAQALQELSAKLQESEARMREMEAAAAKNKEEMEKLLKAQKEGQKSPEIDKAIEAKRKEQEALDAKLKEAEQAKKAIQQQTQSAAPASAPPPAAAGTTTPPAGLPAPAGTAPPAAAQPAPGGAPPPPPEPVIKPEPAPAEPAKSAPSVKEGELVPIAEVDTPPVPTKKVPPAFPPIAKMKKITGKVTVKVLVSEKGKPDQVEVVSISPPSNVGFDKAALEAVRQWDFQPATKEGVRVKCWFLIPVAFE
jgi:TonB family protein